MSDEHPALHGPLVARRAMLSHAAEGPETGVHPTLPNVKDPRDRHQPAFEMRGVSKTFPGVRALSDVSLACLPGEVHALVGENGAGKSTLIKVLSGVHRPDSGSILIHGEEVRFGHPLDALNAGISVIYQEFSLLPDRTVAQNIFLGREPTRRGLIDIKAMNEETRRVLDTFGVAGGIAADAMVGDLGVAGQQMVEIAKAISLNAKVVIMDEPTAALNERECDVLFSTVDMLRARGTAIVYISHRMREIGRLADRVTVLKDGAVAARFDHVPETDSIIRAMVGREIADLYPPPATQDEVGDRALSVRSAGNASLRNISFDLRAGEITAFAGIQGAGRAALAMAVFGMAPFETGSVVLAGKPVEFRSPRDAIRCGIGLLPGDRKAEALLLMQTVRDNGMVSSRAASSLLGPQGANAYVSLAEMDALFDRMNVRADYQQEIKSLSGGNQQKALIARWLAVRPKVLIFIEPTRGVDVSAKASIYHLMRELARAGTAIMIVSSDLPEVLGVADRVLVMQQGEIVAGFDRGATEEEIMHAATGGKSLTGKAA